MTPDQFNACFEFLGGLFILDHCRTTIRARAVAGVSVPAVLFFTAWGGFNLYYYPSLGQTFSFFAGIFVLATNLLWIALILHFKTGNLHAHKTGTDRGTGAARHRGPHPG